MSILDGDRPINSYAEDLFGFKEHVEALHKALAEADLTGPTVVGVYGSWGSGKTSFMKLLQARFEQNSPGSTMWLNAWAYDRREAVWAALILSVVNKIEATETLGDDLKRAARTLATTVLSVVASQGIRAATHGFLTREELDKAAAGAEQRLRAIDELTTNFKDEFQKVVKDYLAKHLKGAHKPKLVVFLDDLDRCTPQNVVDVFEALKLFLTEGPCIYVLGVDPVAIEQALKAMYPESSDPWARGFLEKIVDVVYRVPRVTDQTLLDTLGEKIGFRLPSPPSVAEIARTFVAGNPRRAKRFTLAYQIAFNGASDRSKAAERFKNALALGVGLRAFYPGLARAGLRNPDGLHLFMNYLPTSRTTDDKPWFLQQGLMDFTSYIEDPEIYRWRREIRPVVRGVPDFSADMLAEGLRA